MKSKTYLLINGRQVFTISLIVIALTILGVYLWGLGQHHTFFENSVISTTILSVAFFLFIAIGLYKGVKLKDNLGRVVDRFRTVEVPDFALNMTSSEPIDIGEGIVGVIVSIALWILMAILFSIALWIFSNVFVIIILTFVAMLYWVFFRALRLVFKNSNKSKGDIMQSLKLALAYTTLYNFWIYGIFFLTAFLKK